MKYFSKIYLKDEFSNISITEENNKYTAFIKLNIKIFVFRVLPFKLKTSPTHFQKIMENNLIDLIAKRNVLVYMDDIIILRKDENIHMKVRDIMFKLLLENNLIRYF